MTSHACQRWQQRVNSQPGVTKAIKSCMKGAMAIPNRYTRRWGRITWSKSVARSMRKRGTRYYFTPAAVLITCGDRIVTVVDVTDDDLATFLVWKMMNFWLEEEGPTRDRYPKHRLS